MLKELRTQHRNIIQMSFSGFTNNEICEKLGLSPSTVSQIIRSPLGQAYLNGLNDRAKEDILDVRKKLVSLNKGALGAIERILDPRQKAPHSVQLTAAKDVLDRNGYKPPDKISIDMSISAKTDAEIEAEILAMEQSIAKTRTQDPIKITDNQPKQIEQSEIDESVIKHNAEIDTATNTGNLSTDVNFSTDVNLPLTELSNNKTVTDSSINLTEQDWQDYDELDLGDEVEIFDDSFEEEVEDFLADVFADEANLDESLIKSIPPDVFNSVSKGN